MKTRKRIIVQTGLLVGLLLLTACSGRADSLEIIQERGVLLIGLDPTYVPFEALAPDGGLYGLDVDLGRELANRLGVEASFVLLGYDGLYDSLEIEEVDVLISALWVEAERSEDVVYSSPYVDAGLRLVVREDSPNPPRNMEEMAGRSLAVEYASEADAEARRWARRLGNLTVESRNTAGEALAAVESGTADAALVDAITARLYRREHPTLVVGEEPITSEPYAVALRAGERSLLNAIDDVLAEMEADGTLQAIRDRWL